MTAGANPSGQATPERQFAPGPSPQPDETPTTPLHEVAPGSVPMQAQPGEPAQPQVPPAVPTHAVPAVPAMHSAGNDQCPNCGSHMARDQRYCLECGSRRGDPRLPFMDAVVFMDSVKQPHPAAAAAAPPSPPEKRGSRMSANASLIAGVATLVLAIGVGVLIGRSGENNGSTAANTPQVIKVEGGGGGGTEAEASSEGSGKVEKDSSESTGKGGGEKKQANSLKEAENEQAAESVLKTNPNAKPLPPPTIQKGEKCDPGEAGCGKSGKFEGTFFE